MTDSPSPDDAFIAGAGNRESDESRPGLDRAKLPDAPDTLFAEWLDAAISEGVRQANGMVLATVSQEAAPSARVVLLRDFSEQGLVFYTNRLSRKGRQIAENPRSAATFWWEPLERQVRIEGVCEVLSQADSESYFRGRPRGSQIGAWASPQSEPLTSREELEVKVAEVEARFEGEEVPLPDFWGGYRLVPTLFEFWQGRRSRLHDRVRFVRTPSGWHKERLAP